MDVFHDSGQLALAQAVKPLGDGPASPVPSAPYGSCVSVPSTDALTPRGKGPIAAYCTPGGPSQLCFSGSPGAPGSVCQMHWPWEEQDLGCGSGLHIWRMVRVPSRIRGPVGHCPTHTGNETMAEAATAPLSASLEAEFGPEVPVGACETCLEHTKLRADCLWISARLPTQTYARGEKQAASLQVLVQPAAHLPLNCHMKARILKVISAVSSAGRLCSKCGRDRILQRGIVGVLPS